MSLAFAPFVDLYEAPSSMPGRLLAVALHALDPVIRVHRLYRYLRRFHAFDRRRFVMLRPRQAVLVAAVLLLLEFRHGRDLGAAPPCGSAYPCAPAPVGPGVSGSVTGKKRWR